MTLPPRRTPRSPQRAALTVATDAYGLPVEPDATLVGETSVSPQLARVRDTSPTAASTGSPRSTTISVRLSGDLLERFEEWATDHRWSRGRAATVAIERILDADSS